jgi:hypothetical protein
VTYRKPYFVSDSSTVRSRSVWKKPTTTSAVMNTPKSSSPKTRAATIDPAIPHATAA